jgi:RNA polymerase sigma-70 factor (ECF subfamily)
MPPLSSLPRFEALALPCMEAAYNLAFWLVRSRPDAEDIVQEAYLRAMRAFDGFRGDDIRPWLLAIVRNTAYRWLNNRRRSGTVVSLEEAFADGGGEGTGANEIATGEPSAEQRLIGAAEQDYVLRALAELPPAFREVLVLREIEDLSYRDIAEVTGAPIGTVMSRLSRGRAELRKVLTRLIEKDEPNAM